MKQVLGLIVVLLAMPAFGTTYINADADSARIPAGQVSTIVPLTGGTGSNGSAPRNAVQFPNQSSTNCASFNIPALPQTMSAAPSLNCGVTIRDIAASPASTVAFIFAAQAFPTGTVLTDRFLSVTTGTKSITLAGAAQYASIASDTSGVSTNFPVMKNASDACGPECLGAPLVIYVCRATATGDTVQLVNVVCQE